MELLTLIYQLEYVCRNWHMYRIRTTGPIYAPKLFVVKLRLMRQTDPKNGTPSVATRSRRPAEPGAAGVCRLHLTVWSQRCCTFTLRKLNRSEGASSLNSSAWHDGTWVRTHFFGSGVCEPMINRDCLIFMIYDLTRIAFFNFQICCRTVSGPTIFRVYWFKRTSVA